MHDAPMTEGGDLMERVDRLARMARRSRTTPGDISRSGLRLLRVVRHNAGIRTSELAKKLDIRPSSLTDALDRLEAGGYVTREKDPSDQRVLRVFITDRAQQQFDALERQRRAQSEALRTQLTEDEARQFCELCDRLTDYLRGADAP